MKPWGKSFARAFFPRRLAALTAVFLLLIWAGCGGNGSRPARNTVEEALAELEKARAPLQDLAELNAKINQLGKRFDNKQDTVSEGMSLVGLIDADINELEGVLRTARGLFERVETMEGAGEYRRYAEMAGRAVDAQMAALQTNRELVRTLAELLSLVELAESGEQLQYYVDELERLAGELERRNAEASRLAAEADDFYAEKRL